MVLKFPASEFFEDFGGTTQEFGARVRDAIVSHTCDIWQNYPKWITEGTNPVSSFQRGFMNSACSKKPGFVVPVIEPPPFAGGQCEGKLYTVFVDFARIDFQGNVAQVGTRTFLSVPGRIGGAIAARTAGGGAAIELVQPDLPDGQRPRQAQIGGLNDTARIDGVRVETSDGSPDDCGDLSGGYPDVAPPTSDVLNVDITINDVDGSELSFPLTWYSIGPDFNFPITLDVGGIDVSLDLGGLTLKGDLTINNPRGINEPSDDTDKDVTLPDGTIKTLPRPVAPPILPEDMPVELEDVDLEWVVCESGVLEVVNEIIKVTPGTASWLKVLFPILVDIIEELCTEGSDVGVPEIYPVLPGAERPVIMYYFKENLGDGKKGVSTYTSSLPNPTTAAVNEIGRGVFPNRVLGKFVCTIRLLDGSRLIGRGNTEVEGRSYLTYLLNRTNPANIPTNFQDCIVVTVNQKFSEVKVECSQAEYYPDGKAFAVNPSVQEIIRFE